MVLAVELDEQPQLRPREVELGMGLVDPELADGIGQARHSTDELHYQRLQQALRGWCADGS